MTAPAPPAQGVLAHLLATEQPGPISSRVLPLTDVPLTDVPNTELPNTK